MNDRTGEAVVGTLALIGAVSVAHSAIRLAGRINRRFRSK